MSLTDSLALRAALRLAGAVLTVAAVSGCDWMEPVTSLFSRSGAKLASSLEKNRTVMYRTQVNAVIPVVGADGKAAAKTVDLAMKVSSRTGAEISGGWIVLENEITEGQYMINGQPTPVQLAGRRITAKISELRGVSQWQGLTFPVGVELLEIGVPKGRVQPGEKWKIEATRVLLHREERIAFSKFYTYQGDGTFEKNSCHKLAVSIPATTVALGDGSHLQFSGSGEVWIAKKDGLIRKATEIIEGTLPAGRFAQAVSLYDAAVAPADLPSPLAAAAPPSAAVAQKPAVSATGVGPAPAPSATSAASPRAAEPAPAAKAPARESPAGATQPAESTTERLVYVSNATGKREVWSVRPDGADKRCLTGYDHPHWGPAFDPAGEFMAAVSHRPDGVNVWCFDFKTGGATPLTQFSETDDIRLQWGRGGEKVVFMRAGTLWSVHRDSFNLQSHRFAGDVIDFSANHKVREVAVVVNELNRNVIFMLDIFGGAVRELCEGEMPSWSPDCSKIAFRNGNSLNVIHTDASKQWRVLERRIGNNPIMWEPSGKNLILTTLEGESPDVIMIEVGEGETKMGASVNNVTSRGGEGCAISSDGKRVAYLLYGDLWITHIDKNVHVRLTADGTTQRPIWWGMHHVE